MTALPMALPMALPDLTPDDREEDAAAFAGRVECVGISDSSPNEEDDPLLVDIGETRVCLPMGVREKSVECGGSDLRPLFTECC